MTKTKIILITTLATFSLIVIIVSQIYWLNNAIKVEKQKFDDKVNSALNSVIKKMETKSTFFIMEKSMPTINSFLNPKNGNFQNITKDTLFYNNTYTHSANIFHYQNAIINQIEHQRQNVNRAFNHMFINFFNEQILESIYTKTNLENILNQEFIYFDIKSNFEFKIISKDNTIVKSEGFKDKYLSATYKKNLFPNNIFSIPNFLYVYFPNKNFSILKSISLIHISSIFFIFVMIISFFITIITIIKQKKNTEIRNDFISNMTHELKTPIATISLAADTIINPIIIDNKKNIVHYVAMIKKENDRMNKQVEKVLQISLLDKNKFNFNIEKINIKLVVEDVVSNIRLQVERRKGIINVNCEEQLFLNIDKEHFINVITNLLDNANKYSADAPEIDVYCKKEGNKILIGVQDRGIGMTKNVQAKIFEKFYRATTGNVHSIKGFGLGLSYVKAVVLSFNGEINVTSEPGKGSNFEIIFPTQ